MAEVQAQGQYVDDLKRQLEEARHAQATMEDEQQSSAEQIRSLQTVSWGG